MILSLILTLVICICLWFVTNWINGGPFADPKIKWGLCGIAILIAVLCILSLWGILPGIEGGCITHFR